MSLDFTRQPVVQLEDALAAMEAAAGAQDEVAFLAACKLVDWSKSDAATFETAIHLAFAAGAHMVARKLATEGAALHADSEYLRKAAYVLAPPTVIGHRPASNSGNAANKSWMMANRNAFWGQWVALRSGELLGSSDKLSNLIDQFGIHPDILYTQVT